MSEQKSKEEIRWLVVKAMIDEFPILRQKVKKYVSQKKEVKFQK